MRQSAVEFTVDGQPVEGIVASPVDMKRPFPAALVCHPHPLMGGNMESAVVVAICAALALKGMASLRFDFRRPADPEPDPDEMAESAHRDVAAGFGLLRRWRDARPRRCAAAGYSFGAAAVAGSAADLGEARAFALVAPPVARLSESTLLADPRPKLVLVGERDQLVSPIELERVCEGMAGPVSFEVLEGADHFFGGQADEVGGRVASFLANALL